MTFQLLSFQGAILCATFFIAGIIDAVCGGGGLLTLPMFMAVGFPAHFVAGTNQCSILCGGATSLVRFAKGGHIHWRSALPVVPFTIIGALLGSKLNILLPEEWLEVVMVLLVPIVAVVVLFKHDFGAENHIDSLSIKRRLLASLFIGLVIGTYQGFYGAGSGTFFLLGFAVLMKLDLTTASGNTKVVAFCSAVTSAVTYAVSGNVFWEAAIAATVFNIVGSYVGAGLALKRGAKFIRPMFLVVLGLLFVRLVVSWFM